jgi:DNA-binding MarR family transcriptional regulator
MTSQPENYGLIVRHIARGFTRVLQDEIANSEITAGEYRVLRAIQEGPKMHSEIAQLAAMDRPFVTALTKKLTAKGLVVGRPNREDRRRTDLRLTPRGKRLVEAISKRLVAGSDRIATKGISAAELRVFADVGKRMVANFADAYSAGEDDQP